MLSRAQRSRLRELEAAIAKLHEQRKAVWQQLEAVWQQLDRKYLEMAQLTGNKKLEQSVRDHMVGRANASQAPHP
jgi:hypothetical protein